MPDYAAIRSRAAKSIQRAGAPAVIRRSATSGTTPWNPGAATTQDYDVYAAIVDYEIREIDGTNIRRTDQKAIISAEGLEIEIGTNDVLVMGEKSYNIISAQPLAPAGLIVIYQAQVRR
jgi:hypothetical protein